MIMPVQDTEQHAWPLDAQPTRRHSLITGADRVLEQQLKEQLDAIAYRIEFFRDSDEPNEIFAPRLIVSMQQQIARGARHLA